MAADGTVLDHRARRLAGRALGRRQTTRSAWDKSRKLHPSGEGGGASEPRLDNEGVDDFYCKDGSEQVCFYCKTVEISASATTGTAPRFTILNAWEKMIVSSFHLRHSSVQIGIHALSVEGCQTIRVSAVQITQSVVAA